MKKVGIVMGSDSDLPIIQKATDTLKGLNIPFEVHIYSAHRTPVEARDFALSARDNGFGVIIAAAGMAAHLAGAIAANTTLPVIGIPCKSSVLDGMDALLSTVMMPSGIPVTSCVCRRRPFLSVSSLTSEIPSTFFSIRISSIFLTKAALFTS